MLTALFYLKDSYERLMRIKDKLQKEVDILKRREEREQQGKKNRGRANLDISDILRPLANAFLDFSMAIEESKKMDTLNFLSPLAAMSSIMPIIEKLLDEEHEAEELINTLGMIEEALKTWIDDPNINNLKGITEYYYQEDFKYTWCYKHSYGQELSEEGTNIILNAIKHRQYINVLEISCKQGFLAERISRFFDTAKIYGVDIYKAINRDLRPLYRRCIYGSLKGALISRNAFDLLFCLPKITMRQEMRNNVYLKNEREVLFRSIEYLKPGGTLVYAIPYFRFYREICDHLSKYYTDFQVFTTEEDWKNSLVIVVCKKLEEPLVVPDRNIYNKLRRLSCCHSAEDILYTPTLNQIILSDTPTEIKKFRGSELNEEELADLYRVSHTTHSFWKDQTVEKLGDSKSRPLLPFNVGQLGLILTSGCLDGVIDEKNGFYHAVKGRVVKRIDVSENSTADNRQIQLINTTGNKVEINVFLPDGTYKCLA